MDLSKGTLEQSLDWGFLRSEAVRGVGGAVGGARSVELLTWCLYVGPFRFVDSFGAQNLLDKINHFREVYGEHFDPAPLLVDYAKDPSRKFYPS